MTFELYWLVGCGFGLVFRVVFFLSLGMRVENNSVAKLALLN